MPPDDPVSTEKLKRWERDNLCGICPYRQSIQAENERLREALEAAQEQYRNLLRAGEDQTAAFERCREVLRLVVQSGLGETAISSKLGDDPLQATPKGIANFIIRELPALHPTEENEK